MNSWEHRKKPKSDIWRLQTHKGWAELVLTTLKKDEHQLTISGEDYERAYRNGLMFTSSKEAKRYIEKLKQKIVLRMR